MKKIITLRKTFRVHRNTQFINKTWKQMHFFSFKIIQYWSKINKQSRRIVNKWAFIKIINFIIRWLIFLINLTMKKNFLKIFTKEEFMQIYTVWKKRKKKNKLCNQAINYWDPKLITKTAIILCYNLDIINRAIKYCCFNLINRVSTKTNKDCFLLMITINTTIKASFCWKIARALVMLKRSLKTYVWDSNHTNKPFYQIRGDRRTWKNSTDKIKNKDNIE